MTEDPVNKDLYILIGRYEEYTQETNRRLERIEDSLEKGTNTFAEIHKLCAQRGETLLNYGERIEDLEDKDSLGGTSNKEKAGLWGMIAYQVIRIASKLLGYDIP